MDEEFDEYTADICELCSRVAGEAHTGQLRRDGQPYMQHPLRVADTCARHVGTGPLSNLFYCIAVLHDVLEDTSLGVDDLAERGIPSLIVNQVVELTRRSGESYEHYIKRVRKSHMLRVIKVADMLDNLCDDPTPAQKKRYTTAILQLL